MANHLGLYFNVNVLHQVLIPEARSSWGAFDEHGLSSSLQRLQEEKNSSYKRRIRDAWARQANSSNNGILFGLTRELNLSITETLQVNPRIDANGNFLAPDPLIQFDGAYLYLYSDYSNNLLDYKIDRYESGRNYEYVSDLVDLINSTVFFEAGVIGTHAQTRSMCIYNQQNLRFVDVESVPVSTKFRLEKEFIRPGTVFFSDRRTFMNEVSTESSVNKLGDFYIDYRNGIVKVFCEPIPGTHVRYQYFQYPFIVRSSPVIVCDINNLNFKPKVFDQILTDEQVETDGLPTRLGVDIVNELLTLKGGLYWGR